ncbi:MAG: class I SAM-dependent methyltransferase [Nitrospirae bacterium]|nr:class I SAM-dependent methyltransferase [Nitrospirota bacterium]
MKDVVYKLLGRMSLCFDWIRPLLSSGPAGSPSDPSSDFDKTGLLVREARPLKILWKDPEIVFVEYDSLAHSFWRAQELSLFSNHQSVLEEPVLDFGCGDGSFASVLFKSIEYGVDHDPEALEIASGYKVYHQRVQSTMSRIPLDDASVRSVFSNSVLEHVGSLDDVLSEIRRILSPGGRFVFTVPVRQFKLDLAKYFGWRESVRINREYHHWNLLDAEDWEKRLRAHGFSIDLLKPYQPDWFTFWYRMFRLAGDRGLGRFFPTIRSRIWRRFHSRLIGMVRRSIQETRNGANIFVIARKEPAG